MQSWVSYFQVTSFDLLRCTSTVWVKISVESYPLPFILRIMSAESCPLATKVTYLSVVFSGMPNAKIWAHDMEQDKGQGTRDRGQGTKDRGQGTRDNGQRTQT
jgi:hypothetical protein